MTTEERQLQYIGVRRKPLQWLFSGCEVSAGKLGVSGTCSADPEEITDTADTCGIHGIARNDIAGFQMVNIGAALADQLRIVSNDVDGPAGAAGGLRRGTGGPAGEILPHRKNVMRRCDFCTGA